MTIYFLSRSNRHQIKSNLIKKLLPEQFNLQEVLDQRAGRPEYGRRDGNWYVIGHDIENRFTLPSREGLLLSGFCILKDVVLVIDNTTVQNNEIFTEEILHKCLFVSHNADHEARWGIATNFLPGRYACTMVNGKRLLSGQEGFRYDLISEISRHLGYKEVPIWMEKDIRNTFADCEFFEDEHILYNASDTLKLVDLYNAQCDRADELGMDFLFKLNSRLIIPIAKAEMTGIRHDTPKWLGIARDRKEKADILCKELNTILEEGFHLDLSTVNPVLRKEVESREKKIARLTQRKEKLNLQLCRLEAVNKTHLKSYLVTQEAYLKTVMELATVNDANTGSAPTSINWGSQKQILEALRAIGCPLPESKDKNTHQLKPGVGKEARASWLVNHEGSPFSNILSKFDEYKKLIHNVNSFGENWVNQYVREGRVFTLLDQAGTDTGRLSSGDKGKVKRHPNLQQVPNPPEYRECFIADDGRLLGTLDYKNCEGVVMISQSGDLGMKAITELPDQHSYLGTKCWRNVYKRRYQLTGDDKWRVLSETYVMDQSTPEKKKERSIFKNSGGLFPVAYGVFASKVAGAAKITEAEAQIFIDTIKAEVPLVIKYLDSVSAKAIKNGYAIHNTRTGSRRYFQAVLDKIHYGWPIPKGDIVAIESAARNTVIQGTNSDLIKEAICILQMWIDIYKVPVRFLLTVHDELLVDVPEENAEFYIGKVRQIMERTAQKYLIPEIQMGTSCDIAKHWHK